MTESETPTPVAAPVVADKPEPPKAFVISEKELDELVGRVKPKNDDEKAIYNRAISEVRAEVEALNKTKLEESVRTAETARIANLEKEIAELKAQSEKGTFRKGMANTVNPFKKDDKGRTGVPLDEVNRATKAMLFPQA